MFTRRLFTIVVAMFCFCFGVFCCPHVFRKEKPILLVIRDPDGDWHFLCDKGEKKNDCHHIGVGHLLQRDKTLDVMVNLSVATGAKREDVLSEWDYFELENDDDKKA